MNYPTREEFEALRQEFQEKQRSLEEEVRQLKEQRTDEMKAINVNVASADVLTRLDTLKTDLTHELHTVSDTWLSTLQGHYTEHTQAISDVQTVQKGHAKFFEEHGRRLGQIETAMATKDDIARLENLIKQLLPPQPES